MLNDYVVLLMAQDNPAAAEKVILRSLKQNWDSALVRQYGLLETEDSARQLRRAESWLPDHTDDSQLLLCLGRLAARDKLWGKARDYFESSYRLERSAELCAELGRLLVALEEPEVAAAYYREGLQMRENALPDLPMPNEATLS
jgi:HemY protein